MTFAGKKLQDIYDSGSESLQESEANVRQRLKKNAEEHFSHRKNGKDDSLNKIEEGSKELEKDIRSFIDHCVGRLSGVLEDEVKETEQQLASVKKDLTNLSEKLKGSIADLKKTYEENIKHISDGLTDQYIGSVEQSTIELEKQDYNSTKHLRAHGTFVINSLQQKLDHCLWESRGEEKQYNSTLFKTFMQKANSIDTHFSSLMQKLSSDFQTYFKVLETQSQQIEYDLNQQSFELFQGVDKHAADIEQDIEEFFKAAQEQHSRNLDTSLTSMAHDLSSVHDETTTKLNDQTKDLSNSLISASGVARDDLGTKCGDLRQTVDRSLSAFRTKMEDKLKGTTTMKETLENEKRSIFESIHKELTDIWESFEKRMTALMTESVSRVNNVTSEAEKEILYAHNNCQSKLRTDGTACKDQIEEAINKFLTQLAQQKNAALEEISKSAGDQSTPSSKTDGSRVRRSRRTREDSLDTEG